jgi:tetratricopeptide (TPR) repeat protein
MDIARMEGREEIFNIYAYRGETLRAMGFLDEAIADLTAAINLSPYPQYYYLRGLALKAAGRLTEAEEDFRRAGNQTGPVGWHNKKFGQD